MGKRESQEAESTVSMKRENITSISKEMQTMVEIYRWAGRRTRRGRTENNESKLGRHLPDSEQPYMIQKTRELYQQTKESH